MRDYEANAVLSTKEYRVVGRRPVRHDGADKVTGKARYGADMVLPRMLYGRILRSPHAHARIESLDTSRAEAAPGVKAVVTARDFPGAGWAARLLPAAQPDGPRQGVLQGSRRGRRRRRQSPRGRRRPST